MQTTLTNSTLENTAIRTQTVNWNGCVLVKHPILVADWLQRVSV